MFHDILCNWCMEINMEKFHNELKNLSTFKLILISIASMFVVQLLITPFYRLYPINSADSVVYDMYKLDTFANFLRRLFFTGIIHPIIETLIFQTLIIRVVLILTKKIFMKESLITYLIPIVISSIAFGYMHFYGYNSIVKIINTFLLGLILAYTYVVAYTSGKKATRCVICVHAIWNSYAVILNYLIV